MKIRNGLLETVENKSEENQYFYHGVYDLERSFKTEPVKTIGLASA